MANILEKHFKNLRFPDILQRCCRCAFETSLHFFISSASILPLCHPVTLFCTVVCPTYPPPCPATSTPLPPPCTAWSRVRTCRLPLFWVSVIQFSGRYKPVQCHTPPPPISLTYPGHKTCRQPHMVLKVPTHTSPSPPVSLKGRVSLS